MAKKKRKQLDQSEPTGRDRQLKKMERAIRSLASSLVELDPRHLDAAVKVAERYPGAACHRLFRLFGTSDPGLQAVLPLVLRRWAVPDVMDNLGALVFDETQDETLRLRAAALLGDLGQPIDTDVLEMSIPKAGELLANLAEAAWEKLRSAEPDEGAAVLASLPDAFRLVMVHRLAGEAGEDAISPLTAAAADDAAVAEAVAIELGRTGQAFGARLLQSLEEHPNRNVQKAARRSLFALKAAGVTLPEPPPKPKAEAPAAAEDAELPLHRSLVLEETRRQGVRLVVVARERPDGYLKVAFVVVDLYKSGIRNASCRLEMSKSAFRRRVETPDREGDEMRPVALEECQRLVARGLRVAQILGNSVPYEFQVGRDLLGDLGPMLAEFENPFLCEACGAALSENAVERIKELAAYEHIPVEPVCESCGKKAE